MSLPEYQNSCSNSRLLTLLSSTHGFTAWFKFSGLEGFYPALGYALLLHHYLSYPSIWRFMDKTYRETISPIIKVDAEYSAYYQQQRYQLVEYWLAIGNACKEVCIIPFADKPHVISRIQAGKMLDFEDADHYATLASHLHISLAMHRWVDSEPKTYHYCKANNGQIVVYVNLAFERNCVYSLVHCNFQAQTAVPEPMFPHYMLYERKGQSALIFTSTAPQEENREIDRKDTLIRNMSVIIGLLAKEAATGMTFIPRTLQDTHSQLMEVHKQVAPLLQDLLPECDINTEDMGRLFALPIEQEADTRTPHTCATCTLYPEVQAEGVNDHGHFFHLPCLDVHFQHITQVEDSLKCPIPTCPHRLPEILLNLFPAYKQRYTLWKQQQLDSYTTSKLNATKVPCSSCKLLLPITRQCTVDEHRLCRNCCKLTWDSHQCVVCRKPLSIETQIAIQSFMKEEPQMPFSLH